MTQEKKIEIYRCIVKQFPDSGIYKISRVSEWLATNGYVAEKLGYGGFGELIKDFPEALMPHPSGGGNDYVIVKKWESANISPEENTAHPADSFFGSNSIMLNDDIIEMSQQSLYALTKVLDNGLNVQEMKAQIYERFKEAKENNTLSFFAERYSFPIDCCKDGFLVKGIITKNISPRGKSLYFSFEKTAIFYGEPAPEPQKTALAKVSVTDTDKRWIYTLLSQHFAPETPHHMAAISKLLTDSGFDRQKYGVYKMKDLLRRLDFLTMEDVILGGVPQIMVTIHRSSKYELPQVIDEPAERKKPNDTSDIPSEAMSEFCNLPSKPVMILQQYLQTKGQLPSVSEIKEALCEDFESARGGSIRMYEGKLLYPSRYLKPDGSPVEITLKRSTYEGKPWFLNYIDTVPHNPTAKIPPGKQLESFAFLGSWSGFLSELAEKAVYEEWDFAGSSTNDYHILIQYIKYTFYRLTKENKICISSDRMFAAFNTGLVDRHYDDLYACFVPNDGSSDTKWKFSCFCTAASRGMGKLLVNYFNPLPQPPQYVRNKEDLIFDLEKPLHTDFDHIIIDNIRRLPIDFLFDQMSDCPEGQSIIIELRSADRFRRRVLYDRLREILSENDKLFIRIQNRIKDAIELARKRVHWNYKTAIPSYFPKRDTMSLMLPLSLLGNDTADVALVVENTPSGNYQGQTILTMTQAYINARLLCRINSDWLTEALPSADVTDEETE